MSVAGSRGGAIRARNGTRRSRRRAGRCAPSAQARSRDHARRRQGRACRPSRLDRRSIGAGRRAPPVRVRPRLPARRRDLRDAPGNRRPSDRAWRRTRPPAGHLLHGLTQVWSVVHRDPENPLTALKTTGRADFLYARVEARRAGADHALFLTIDGHLSEATSANIFLVRGSELATPSLGCAILAGTTRTWILRWAAEAGLSVVEGWLTSADLAAADEAFLCSSVAGDRKSV